MKRERIILHPAARAGFVAAAVAIALLLTGAVAFADTYTVDRTDDVGSASACTAAPNDCSLRGAVNAANTHLGGDTIKLPAGTYDLTLLGVNEDANATSDLDVLASGGNLSIEGAGATSTVIRGLRATYGLVAGIERVLHIDPAGAGGIHVNLNGLTLRDGYGGEHGGGILMRGNNVLNVSESRIIKNTVTVVSSAAGGGGGIAFLDNAEVFLYATDVMTNTTQATVVGPTSGGGGIYNQGSGQIVITQSRVSGNRATVIPGGTSLAAGGGLYNDGGRVLLSGTEVNDNTATGGTIGSNGAGGGIYNTNDGLVTLESGAQVAGNVADVSGGGIYNLASTLAIGSSDVSDNKVTGGQDEVDCQGGGIVSTGGSNLVIDNSGLSRNQALLPAGSSSECWGGALVNEGSYARVGSSTFTQNQATTGCGAIYDLSATILDMSGSTLASNTGGMAGGGLCNRESTATIADTTFDLNTSGGSGGGMYNNNSIVTLDRCKFLSNSALDGFGGGVFHVLGELTVTGSTVDENNSSSGGGGLLVVYSVANIDTTTFSDNSTGSAVVQSAKPSGAASRGDGFLVDPFSTAAPAATSAQGGGLLLIPGTASITNSTFSGNRAADSGGGLRATTGSLIRLVHVTVTGNRADHYGLGAGDGGGLSLDALSTLYLKNSIVSGNVDTGGEAPECAGTISTAGDNLIQDPTGCTLGGAGTNLTGIDPLLRPLLPNGGPTETHALPLDSPALDTVVDCTDLHGNLVTVSQNDELRPQREACDMGAYEQGAYTLYLPVSLRAYVP